MQLLKTIEWIDPLEVAKKIPDKEENWVFFYSCFPTNYTGHHSIIALNKSREIKSGDFSEAEKSLSSNKSPFDNSWFGYLGYGLKNCLEKLPYDEDGYISLPNLWLVKFSVIIDFDHIAKKINVWGETEQNIPDILLNKSTTSNNLNSQFSILSFSSNMNKAEYIKKIEEIKNSIHRGDIYQANLTRKFYGQLSGEICPLELFYHLVKISPSPYSAFLKLGENYILSSSPERFLTITYDGTVESRPIKGSAPRSSNKNEDEELYTTLLNSPKERAENLMIVDLMRNDLSRACLPGSISVPALFEINSYATVHHMSSIVRGHKDPSRTSMDLIKSCFPPGSMTGAPKISAMKKCSELEKIARGVYSGALGWFGGDGSVDLSVVIRTLLIQKNKFEFQVGGGIVSDSEPEDEWRETLLKAKAIISILGIDAETIKSL